MVTLLVLPQVETGANYVVHCEDYLTKFTINDAERKHTGIYKIHAKNDSGSDEAEVEIVVLGECKVLTMIPVVRLCLDHCGYHGHTFPLRNLLEILIMVFGLSLTQMKVFLDHLLWWSIQFTVRPVREARLNSIFSMQEGSIFYNDNKFETLEQSGNCFTIFMTWSNLTSCSLRPSWQAGGPSGDLRRAQGGLQAEVGQAQGWRWSACRWLRRREDGCNNR